MVINRIDELDDIKRPQGLSVQDYINTDAFDELPIENRLLILMEASADLIKQSKE